jgi:hypothetical protein
VLRPARCHGCEAVRYACVPEGKRDGHGTHSPPQPQVPIDIEFRARRPSFIHKCGMKGSSLFAHSGCLVVGSQFAPECYQGTTFGGTAGWRGYCRSEDLPWRPRTVATHFVIHKGHYAIIFIIGFVFAAAADVLLRVLIVFISIVVVVLQECLGGVRIVCFRQRLLITTTVCVFTVSGHPARIHGECPVRQLSVSEGILSFPYLALTTPLLGSPGIRIRTILGVTPFQSRAPTRSAGVHGVGTGRLGLKVYFVDAVPKAVELVGRSGGWRAGAPGFVSGFAPVEGPDRTACRTLTTTAETTSRHDLTLKCESTCCCESRLLYGR